MLVRIHALNRSGATFVSRYLVSNFDCIFLSEVHPVNEIFGRSDQCIATQANLPAQFLKDHQLALKKVISDNTDKLIILRDWDYVNFLPNKLLNGNRPSFEFSKYDISHVLEIGLVRNPLSQYSSQKDSCRAFVDAYSHFVSQLKKSKIKIFPVEDFLSLVAYFEMTLGKYRLSKPAQQERINKITGDLGALSAPDLSFQKAAIERLNWIPPYNLKTLIKMSVELSVDCQLPYDLAYFNRLINGVSRNKFLIWYYRSVLKTLSSQK